MSIDWDKPYKTRDGRRVFIYTRSSRVGNCPVRGEVESHVGDAWNNIAWHSDGAWGNDGHTRDADLVNVPQKHTMTVNVNKRKHDSQIWFCPHVDREVADSLYTENRIACIEVTFTEGEGLE